VKLVGWLVDEQWDDRGRGCDICSCQLVCCDAQLGENDKVPFLRFASIQLNKAYAISEKKELLAIITYQRCVRSGFQFEMLSFVPLEA
jgi:hypothetical protein